MNGVLDEGEWDSDCSFERDLRGIPENVTDDGSWHWEYPPFNQSVTQYHMQDDNNHYLAFQWTHLWLNNTVNDDDSSPDKYIFAAGFDFDHDRVWEDYDNNVHTIDDALALVYLAFQIGEPNATGWFPIYIPEGLYVFSWNATANEGQDITADPGPLDRDGNPVTFNYGHGRTPEWFESNVTYTYTFEVTVPNILFHSTAGFAFGLAQETNFVVGGTQYNETYAWSWPTEWVGVYGSNTDPYSPRYFGILTDYPAPVEAVGGFIGEPTDDILLVSGDVSVNPHGTKPAGVNFQIGRDTTPLGFVSGMLVDPQPSIFDTNSTWINGTSGRPFSGIPSDIIFSVGGPGVNAVSHYYENADNASDRAPIRFSMNATHYIWTNQANEEVLAVLRSSCSGPLGNSDVFVIQTLIDSDQRLVFMIYGTHYYGTWAGAWYFKFVMYPKYPFTSNMSEYTDSYYIIRWTDAASGRGSNYNPDLGDTYEILASG